MSSSRLLLALPAAGETPWVMTFSDREQGGCNVEKPPANAWFGVSRRGNRGHAGPEEGPPPATPSHRCPNCRGQVAAAAGTGR